VEGVVEGGEGATGCQEQRWWRVALFGVRQGRSAAFAEGCTQANDIPPSPFKSQTLPETQGVKPQPADPAADNGLTDSRTTMIQI